MDGGHETVCLIIDAGGEGRFVRAEVIGFVSSDRASFGTGAYYAVDGGYLAR